MNSSIDSTNMLVANLKPLVMMRVKIGFNLSFIVREGVIFNL